MKYVKPIFLIGLICIACIRFIQKPTDDLELFKFKDKKVIIKGIIIEDPEDKGSYQKIFLKVETVSISESSTTTDIFSTTFKTKLLVSLRTHDAIKYGDQVQIEGLLHKPAVVIQPDGSVFDYPTYLAKDNIFYILDGTSSVGISQGHGNFLKKSLILIKQSFLKQISNVLPTPYSFLAGGLVIAGKGSLDKKLQEEFQRVGLIHIVVLSGSNVTIVGQFIIATFSFLSPGLKNIFGGFGIICFGIMAGGSATIVRSVIMSLIGLYANYSGQMYTALKGLFLAGLLMIANNPYIIFYDASFQLSFTATLGLILFTKNVEKRLMWMSNICGLREIVSTCIATQFFVTPLILHLSGMFSFVALLVNVLVLPVIPLTMLLVFITGVMSFIHEVVALPFSFVSYLLLSYELTIVHLFSSFSFASRTFTKLNWTTTLIVYTVYFLVFFFMEFYPFSFKTKSPP